MEYPDAELVFGIVCAVGTDYRPVVDYLMNLLKRARYNPVELHVSSFFREISENLNLRLDLSADSEYKRIDSGMKAGNAIRAAADDPGFLALDVASRIFSSRPGNETDEPEALPFTAHVIISLKREEEVETLRKIYGPGFFLIGIFSSEQERRDYLETQKGIYDPELLSDIIKRDQKEDGEELGQRTRDTFQLADVFVALKDGQYKRGLRKFIELVFGHQYVTPTRDEYGMFLAYSASARSGALARQVGAAILTPGGDLLSVGCNDVPAARGGLYWEGDKEDHREHRKKRDSNDAQKEEIVAIALQKFEESADFQTAVNHVDKEALVKGELLAAVRSEALKAARAAVKAAIADVTEFGRSVHAEMDAITTSARTGAPIAGATLFTTTFPCHTCTRHIIAAGVSRVVYIEPYPKSQAVALHGDAICLGPCNEEDGDRKIPFEPFVGIGPRRFFDLFSLKLSTGYEVERKLNGKTIEWRLETNARPRVPMPPTSYIQREQIISKAIVAKYKEKGIQRVGSETTVQNGSGLSAIDGEDGRPSRKVASMESGRDLTTTERTGTSDDGNGTLFSK